MERHGLDDEIRTILDRQAALEGAALEGSEDAYLARQELEIEKRRLIHKQVHPQPFTVPARRARSAQWREAAGRKRKALAVLRFAKAGTDGGHHQVDSASHAHAGHPRRARRRG